jgi:hypothetical protein
MIKKLPTMAQLEKGLTFNILSAPSYRHLAAAGLFDTVELHLGVERQLHEPDMSEEAEEIADLLQIRRSAGFGLKRNPQTGKMEPGLVSCPGCEETEDDETCGWCQGVGLVSVDIWDRWFESERGCPDHAAGCEMKCPRTQCAHDELNCAVDLPVLVLKSRKMGGSWSPRGDSVRGFGLKGLVAKPAALHRFLSLIATAAGFGLISDD